MNTMLATICTLAFSNPSMKTYAILVLSSSWPAVTSLATATFMEGLRGVHLRGIA